MKARNEEGKIIIYKDLPVPYVSRDRTWVALEYVEQLPEDILESEGFFDLVTPTFDAKLQLLGEIYFDEEKRVFTCPVVDIEYDLDQLLKKRLDEFDQFQKGFSREITELYMEEIALGILPDEVKQLIVVLRQRRDEIIAELQSFRDTENLERLLNYSFYTEETEQFKSMLKELKK